MKIPAPLFKTAFDRVSGLAGKRATRPILNCVLIQCAGGRMSVTASNQDANAVATFDCQATISCCIPHDALDKILAGAGARDLEIVMDGERLRVTSPFRAVIPVFPAAEFDPIPEPKKAECLGVNCEDLAAGIRAVAWAADAKGAVVDLWRSAVHIVTTASSIECSGTDGKTIAHYESGGIGAASDVIIPCQYAPILVDAISGDNADYYASDKFVFGVADSYSVSVKRMEGNYPAVAKHLKMTNQPVGELDVKALTNEVQLCHNIINQSGRFSPCSLIFAEDGVEIISQDMGREFQSKAAGIFQPTTFNCNAALLVEILRHLKTETAKLSLIGGGALMFNAGDLTCALVGLSKLPLPAQTA